jgi:hypothetical protein
MNDYVVAIVKNDKAVPVKVWAGSRFRNLSENIMQYKVYAGSRKEAIELGVAFHRNTMVNQSQETK